MHGQISSLVRGSYCVNDDDKISKTMMRMPDKIEHGKISRTGGDGQKQQQQQQQHTSQEPYRKSFCVNWK